ncbi:MAG: penicillin-binding transpeptidase domain-containing protein, partial [Rhodoferax sp.]|uniref:penicillin-binding transpeptidase domain-containing protein n=1 Tax=Rhodoferax sp. TaxID=50421 RepID=UPI003264AE42
AVGMAAKGKYNSARMEEHQRDHALYIALAPADDPKIALAVIVENAGWGAGSAAPIARRVFDYMLMGQYPSEEDMAAVQKGLAGAPIGKPRVAVDMRGLMAAATTASASTSPILVPANAATKAEAAAKAQVITQALTKLAQPVAPGTIRD